MIVRRHRRPRADREAIKRLEYETGIEARPRYRTVTVEIDGPSGTVTAHLPVLIQPDGPQRDRHG